MFLHKGVVVKNSPQQADVQHRIATLTSTKVRSAHDGPYAWSEAERRIAVELIKKLVYGRPSMLLVPKLRHVFIEDEDGVKVVEAIELDQLVGLRPKQQELIERSYMEAYEQVLSSVTS
jgi:hypothetical protein